MVEYQALMAIDDEVLSSSKDQREKNMIKEETRPDHDLELTIQHFEINDS